MRRLLMLIVSLAACSDEAPPAEPPAAKAQEPAVPSMDAAAVPEPIELMPTPGQHLDSSAIEYQPGLPSSSRHQGKLLELVLRSTPPGAHASIDGKVVGVTPTFARLPADGRAHEFTFSKDGFAVARYRFVATHNGVVHGELLPLVLAPDAGGKPVR